MTLRSLSSLVFSRTCITASSSEILSSMWSKFFFFHVFRGAFRIFSLFCNDSFGMLRHSLMRNCLKLGFRNQASKHLKGLGPQLLLASNISRRGLWSEELLFSPTIFKLGNFLSHVLQHSPLSILIFDSFLIQVNFVPCKGMSIKPRSVIHSENSLMLLSLRNVPILSSGCNMTLNSPIRRIGLLIAKTLCLISSNSSSLLALSLYP